MVSTWVIIGVAVLFVAYSMAHFLHDWREGTKRAASLDTDGGRSTEAPPVTDPFTRQRVRRTFHRGAD